MFSRARVLCRSGILVCLLIVGALASAGWARKVDAPAKKPKMVVPPSLRDDRPLGYVQPSLAAPSDTFVLGEFTFNPGGAPDPQGWISVDQTAQIDTFFHVDDFAGLGGGTSGFLVPLEGNQSFWCDLESVVRVESRFVPPASRDVDGSRAIHGNLAR